MPSCLHKFSNSVHKVLLKFTIRELLNCSAYDISVVIDKHTRQTIQAYTYPNKYEKGRNAPVSTYRYFHTLVFWNK